MDTPPPPPALPHHIAAMVRAARLRHWVRLADGRLAQLHSWPIPAEYRRPGTGVHRKNRPTVMLPTAQYLTVNPEQITEIIGPIIGPTTKDPQ